MYYLLYDCRCKQAEILAGVCGQREALERRVYEQDVQLELSLDELETTVQVELLLLTRNYFSLPLSPCEVAYIPVK